MLMMSSAWRTAIPKPKGWCNVHGEGFSEMYFLSIIVSIRQKIRSSRYACTHVWRVIGST